MTYLPVVLLGFLAAFVRHAPGESPRFAKSLLSQGDARAAQRRADTAARRPRCGSSISAASTTHGRSGSRESNDIWCTPDRHLSVSLPPETVAEGVRRLGWAALVYALGQMAGPFARLVQAAVGDTVYTWRFGIPDGFALGAVIAGLALFAAVREGSLSSRRLLDLGLAFQVLGALGIAVREFWHGLPAAAGAWFLVPGECVWIVVYPLLVPNTPTKVLVSSLLAASMGPAALAYPAAATGAPVGPPIDAAHISSPRTTCARWWRTSSPASCTAPTCS